MLLTLENIYNLDANKETFARAKKIATTRRWRDLQTNGKQTWGQCKSSGAAYYTTVADNTNPEKISFICTCPSRHNPCKHSIALAFLLVEQSGAFRITEGVSERVKELTAKKNAPPPTHDEVEALERQRAAARRKAREKRLTQMQAGLAELDLRLSDILQHGLARAEEQGDEFWENLAARMTDAKLGGIGKRVLSLQNLRGQPDWHLKMLKKIGEIYLLSKGFQNLDKMPPALQQELLNQAGINQKREEILELEAVPDTWLVIGQTENTADEKLYERRTWLYAENIDRIGLLSDFAFQTEPYKETWQVGQTLQGEMIFYPSAYPLRMLAKEVRRTDEPIHWQGYPNFAEFADAYAGALGQNPWLSLFPAFLIGVIPVVRDGELILVDTDNKILPARLSEGFLYKLSALSGGYPIDVFGEWNGEELFVLSTVAADRFVDFTLPPLERKKPVWGGW